MEEIVYIRADANKEIGTGHIMRCLSIADRITDLGSNAVFIIADCQSEQIIREKGYETICINAQWDKLDKEIDIMVELCHKKLIKKLIVDSYFVTKNYLEILKKVTNIVYIDDLDKFIYPVNLLINYNFYAGDMGYTSKYKGTLTKLLLGTAYVPLRKEFENIGSREFSGINKILITSGGTDNFNMIDNILRCLLKKQEYKDIEIYCIIGRFNINREKLQQTYEKFPNIHLLSNVNNMSCYMVECDLCITAGGSTIYELCACGIPSILYSIADNQINVAQKVSYMGLFSWVGDVREDMESCLARIEEGISLYRDGKFWTEISSRMKMSVDGKGALRIARTVLDKESASLTS